MDFALAYISGALSNPILFFGMSFILLLFFGEPVILSIALMSATTYFISPGALILLAIITAIIAEFFWFFLGRGVFTKKIRAHFLNEGMHGLTSLRKKLRVSHPLALLFVARPFTGITILAILLLGKEGVSVRRFFLYSVIVNSFWTPVVVGIGYAAGKGYTWALALFEGLHFGVGTILIFLLVVYFLYKHITQKLTRIALDTSKL